METNKYKVLIDRTRPSSDEIAQRRDFDALLSQYYAAPAPPAAKPSSKGWLYGFIGIAAVATTATIIWMNSDSSTVQTPVLPKTEQTNTVAVAPSTQNNPADHNQAANVAPVDAANSPAQNNNVSSSRQNNAVDQNSTAAVNTATAAAVSAEPSAVYSFINAPLKGADIRRGVFHIQAQSGGEVKYNTGSVVRIPANAFVDASGQAVSGDVEIRYREFHDVADFLCSGIPMQYDSAGKHYDFVSAGMLDISAFKNGKEVYLRKGEKMNVEFASRTSGESYNLYRLNAETKQWQYMGRDKASPAPQNVSAGNAADALTRECTRKMDSVTLAANLVQPKTPQIADKKKHRFNIDVDTVDFPELSSYVRDGSLFEATDASQKTFPENLYDVVWEDAQLSKTKTEGVYKLQLRKGITRQTLMVYPVYSEGSSAAKTAQSRYDAEMKNYLAAKSNLDKQLAGIRSDYQSRIAATGQHATASGFTATVIRAFEISSFGIYNLDQPELYPSGAKLNATLVKKDGSVLGCKTFYLVDKSKNGLFSFNSNPSTDFSFNPSSDNMIWAVDGDKLYIYTVAEFKTLAKSGTAQIRMTRVDRSFRSADEVRAYLQL